MSRNYPGVDYGGADWKSWINRAAQVINGILRGKVNATLDITLATDAFQTTITDARISAYSFLGFVALSAAAVIDQPTIYIASQEDGSCVLQHAYSTKTRNYRMLIIG